MLLSGAFVSSFVRNVVLPGTLASIGSVRSFPRVGHGVGQGRYASKISGFPDRESLAIVRGSDLKQFSLQSCAQKCSFSAVCEAEAGRRIPVSVCFGP